MLTSRLKGLRIRASPKAAGIDFTLCYFLPENKKGGNPFERVRLAFQIKEKKNFYSVYSTRIYVRFSELKVHVSINI